MAKSKSTKIVMSAQGGKSINPSNKGLLTKGKGGKNMAKKIMVKC